MFFEVFVNFHLSIFDLMLCFDKKKKVKFFGVRSIRVLSRPPYNY
jgi:hypothetical protein